MLDPKFQAKVKDCVPYGRAVDVQTGKREVLVTNIIFETKRRPIVVVEALKDMYVSSKIMEGWIEKRRVVASEENVHVFVFPEWEEAKQIELEKLVLEDTRALKTPKKSRKPSQAVSGPVVPPLPAASGSSFDREMEHLLKVMQAGHEAMLNSMEANRQVLQVVSKMVQKARKRRTSSEDEEETDDEADESYRTESDAEEEEVGRRKKQASSTATPTSLLSPKSVSSSVSGSTTSGKRMPRNEINKIDKSPKGWNDGLWAKAGYASILADVEVMLNCVLCTCDCLNPFPSWSSASTRRARSCWATPSTRTIRSGVR